MMATHYVGWAQEAYFDSSNQQMERDLRHQVRAGANLVWIGHNNPGIVNKNSTEPALSYAVYEALMDAQSPEHDDAVAIVDAQHRMLRLCRKLGLQTVFPVGYQTEMGRAWGVRNPDSLRMRRDGQPVDAATGAATFLSPRYQDDIERYYRWVNEHFVIPYQDVLLMLNLADEPYGGDYSRFADALFTAETGLTFDQIQDSPENQIRFGCFQSRYIVEYAKFSAELWRKINPMISTTMSFCGAGARYDGHMPHIESLFLETPPQFQPTFDAYARDGGQTSMPLCDADIGPLFTLTRTLGYYSGKYRRPFWLWSNANSWGLGPWHGSYQHNRDKGTIGDAMANLLYLAILAKDAGGLLRGIAVWNYNVKGQGLFNGTQRCQFYDPEKMFQSVSGLFALTRTILESDAVSPVKVLVYHPDADSYQLIGREQRSNWDFTHHPIHNANLATVFAKDNVKYLWAGNLCDASLMQQVQMVVCTAASGRYVPAEDVAVLREFLARGGIYVGPQIAGLVSAGDKNASGGDVSAGMLPCVPSAFSSINFCGTFEGCREMTTRRHNNRVFAQSAIDDQSNVVAINELKQPLIIRRRLGEGTLYLFAPDMARFLAFSGYGNTWENFAANAENYECWKLFIEQVMKLGGLELTCNRQYAFSNGQWAFCYSADQFFIVDDQPIAAEINVNFLCSQILLIHADGVMNRESVAESDCVVSVNLKKAEFGLMASDSKLPLLCDSEQAVSSYA